MTIHPRTAPRLAVLTVPAFLAFASPFLAGQAPGDNQRIIAGNGRSATDCVRLEKISSGDSLLGTGGAVLANACEDRVDITWCYADGECQRGLGNLWTIDPGQSWPVSGTREIRWAACHGANTAGFEKGTAGLRYICKAPDEPRAGENGLPARPPSGLGSTFDEVITEIEGPAVARDDAERKASDARAAAEEVARASAAGKAERDRIAAADQARLQQEFTKKLATAPAGELFALADELTTAGKPIESRQAMRALVSRFPDSPLAAMAAKQMIDTTSAPKPDAPRPPQAGGAGASSARGCLDLIMDLIDVINQGNPFAQGHPLFADGQTYQSHQWEQEIWSQQILVRTANSLSACSTTDKAYVADSMKQRQAQCRAAAAQDGTSVDCVSGRNQGNDEARINGAIANITRISNGSSAGPAAGPRAAGPGIESCDTDAKAYVENVTAKLQAMPQDQLLQQLRGAIAMFDGIVRIYSKCLPDPTARGNIDTAKAQGAQTLQTCRQMASDPNICLAPPF